MLHRTAIRRRPVITHHQRAPFYRYQSTVTAAATTPPRAVNDDVRIATAATASTLLDHREIGRRQALFMMHPQAGGMAFFLPHGQRVMNAIRRLMRAEYAHHGYHEIATPLLFDRSLWVRSGHWQKYAEHMFQVKSSSSSEGDAGYAPNESSTAEEESSTEDAHGFGLKPMNCPAHCLVYKHLGRSYRDLPLRLVDFSCLHRDEFSGALGGLTRLRQFHQDDAHIFCTPEQVHDEIRNVLRMVERVYTDVFRFNDGYSLRLATRPAQYIGELAQWDQAETILRQVLEKSGQPWEVEEGDGAFYGPKVDVRVRDHQRREHQLATIQLDFQLPVRFGLEYQTKNQERPLERPVMIHRAILGSFERFLALFAEHCQGKWPFWCSPRQALIVPVTTTQNHNQVLEYARHVQSALQQNPSMDGCGEPFHVDVDTSDELLKAKIFHGQQMQYNYLVVVGQRELDTHTIAVRSRDGPSRHRSMTVQELRKEFADRLLKFS